MLDTAPPRRDLRITSDHRADLHVIAQLCPHADYTMRAAAGLILDLAPHTVGRLSAVDRAGAEVPMEEEIRDLTAIRRANRAAA